MNFTTEIKEDQILLKENDETLCWLKETLSQGSVLVRKAPGGYGLRISG